MTNKFSQQRHDLINEQSLVRVESDRCPQCGGRNWDVRREQISKTVKDGGILTSTGNYEIDICKGRLNIPCECGDCGSSYTLRYKLEDGLWNEEE